LLSLKKERLDSAIIIFRRTDYLFLEREKVIIVVSLFLIFKEGKIRFCNYNF
jgi:hypothetical protein